VSSFAWHEPDATLSDMLLTEPGSRIEGDTADVLRVLFHEVHTAAVEHGLGELGADALALRLLPRMHQALADRGYVVRDYARE
jgi:hypothetical protein